MPHILGIHGRIGAGKTTLANDLCRVLPSAQRFSFADGLRLACSHLFRVPIELLRDPAQKDTDTLIMWHEWPLRPPNALGPMTIRELLQQVGMLFRAVDPDVWVNQCLAAIDASPCQIAVIDDVRFPNEAGAITLRFGTLIHLTRQSGTQSTHISETALDHYHFPHTIDNHALTPQQTLERAITFLHQRGWLPDEDF